MNSLKATTPFGLRLYPELREWLKAQALSNRRSMNSEVVLCLEKIKAGQQVEACRGDGNART